MNEIGGNKQFFFFLNLFIYFVQDEAEDDAEAEDEPEDEADDESDDILSPIETKNRAASKFVEFLQYPPGEEKKMQVKVIYVTFWGIYISLQPAWR